MAARLKIGVLTFHACINYGSYWQARCLVEGLRSRGHEAELLNHHCSCVQRAELRCAFQPRLPERASRMEMRGYAAKVRTFIEAIGALPLSRRFSLHEPEAAAGYDAIVVGSDEVWNLRHPWYGQKPIFYGVGLKADRLVSYAASFGNHDAGEGLHPWWAAHLHGFTSISVRDENSRRMIKQSTGRDPTLVLDPCLQFPETALAEPRADGKTYALVYGHGLPDWLTTEVRRWSDRAGVRLVSVGYRNDFADEQLIDVGPIEFARLMAGAEAVITNFFHGCVFALLNRKPFATAPSEYRLNKVRDLALALGAGDRIVDAGATPRDYQRLLSTPPAAQVLSRIGELRQRSNEYLGAALS